MRSVARRTLRYDFANALEQAGRRNEAVAHLRHAAVLDPQSVETHVNLTALLEKLDHTDEALRVRPPCHRLVPGESDCAFQFGQRAAIDGAIGRGNYRLLEGDRFRQRLRTRVHEPRLLSIAPQRLRRRLVGLRVAAQIWQSRDYELFAAALDGGKTFRRNAAGAWRTRRRR